MMDQEELQLLQNYTASLSFLDGMDPVRVKALAYRVNVFLEAYKSNLSISDLFDVLQLQLYLSLVLGEESNAQSILAKITDAFGDLPDDTARPFSSRCITLKIILIETIEGSQAALDFIDLQFQTTWSKLPAIIAKRRATLLKQLGRNSEYITELLRLADIFPLDPEIWSQLSTEYLERGQFDKSLHCLQEVLVINPLAYPVYAIIGDVLLSQIASSFQSTTDDKLIRANQNYLRSVELCHGYTRGWSGVLVTSNRLASSQQQGGGDDIYTKLSTTAKRQLEMTKEISSIGDL